MLFRNISILTENYDIRKNVDVVVKDDRIAEIRDSVEYIEQNDEDVIEGNYLMIPGFYNSHAHSTMALMRGYGENMHLQDWLFTKIFPFEDFLTSEAVYYGTMLSIAESFKYGIVSTSDMYYFTDDMVRAYLESGAKTNVSRAIANPDGIPFGELISAKEMIDAYEKHHGAGDGRILIDASIHAEYTSNEETVIEIGKLAKQMGIRMHVHASETKIETEECKLRRNGRTPVRYFADAGLFDVPTTAAHCVWLEDDDIKILKEKDVFVATNPVSNLKLASGICDLKALADEGVRIAIGTDSVASNNNLNYFEEMKTAMLLAKVKNMDPTVFSPKEILAMGTRNGALSQGREDAGFVKEGYKADVVLLKMDSPNMHPCYDISSNIVLSATDSDIYMTMVDGKTVYIDGEYPTIDLDDTIKGVYRSIDDILGKLNSR